MRATCQVPGHTFQLLFKSKGGDPTDDDMAASIRWDGGPFTSFLLEPALFVAGKLQSATSSQCDNITAVLLPTGNLLVILRRDDRPSEDRLLAVLLNGRTGKPLDVIRDLGAELGGITLKKDRLGVYIRLTRKWRQSSPTQEPAAVIEWVRVFEADGKLDKQWNASPP